MTDTPFTETIHLEDGGELTLTRFPDNSVVRVAHEKNGTRLSFGLTPADTRALLDATGALVVFEETEVIRRA